MRLISGEEKLGEYIYYSFTAEGLIERSGVTSGLPNGTRTYVSFDQKRIATENEIATNCIPIYYYVEPNSPIDNFMEFALFSRLH